MAWSGAAASQPAAAVRRADVAPAAMHRVRAISGTRLGSKLVTFGAANAWACPALVSQ
jgi:hypothetical protein